MTKNNFTKKEIAIFVSNSTGFSKSLSEKIINDLLKIIIHEVKNNNCILKNLGSFKLLLKSERIGRNPKTMEEFKISKRKSITFQPSKSVTRMINE